MSDELIVRHCSPTLAGLKTANMFTCEFSSLEELKEKIEKFNGHLNEKGVKFYLLRHKGKKALIYVCRPGKLSRDLSCEEAKELLEKNGYPCTTIDEQLQVLSGRLHEFPEFPHEIGLFLGYPVEDVEGFILNRGENCKSVGAWKVYGDVTKAEKRFTQYRKCREVYCKKLMEGASLQRLTVAIS
ncbi:MAG: DUF3793 family protein [Anaerovoracaceae bacterium]